MNHRGHHASHHGTSTEQPPDWRERAACAGEDPELWFPVSTALKAAEIALEICHDCPVRQTCLDDELSRGGMQWGIRGGKTEHERRAMLRQKTKPRPAYTCPTCGAGLAGRPGGHAPRYCSDPCREQARREQQAAYDQRRKQVA